MAFNSLKKKKQNFMVIKWEENLKPWMNSQPQIATAVQRLQEGTSKN